MASCRIGFRFCVWEMVVAYLDQQIVISVTQQLYSAASSTLLLNSQHKHVKIALEEKKNEPMCN